jgi:integrase
MVMMKVLTDRGISTAPAPTRGRIELRDLACRGLAFRITAADVRSWCLRFTNKIGRSGRVTLGRYPDITLAKARERADELRRDIANGAAPTTAKRQERAEAGSKTFEHLCQRYMTEHALRFKRSAADDQRNISKHLLPRWGKRPYADIVRSDVIALIEALIADGKPALANRIGALISGIFTFALDAGLITAHPAIKVGKRGVEGKGTRVLSDDELRLFWDKIVCTPTITRAAGLALRLQLTTALRPGEAAGLQRAELVDIDDVDGAAIRLPGERVKNGREHLLPLSRLARETVVEALALAGDSPHVFPSPNVKGAPISALYLADVMRRFKRAEHEGPAAATWAANAPTAHDLRRTVRTRLGALDVTDKIADLVMNHAPQGVGRKHYDVGEYQKQMRDALESWARSLGAILAGGADVVSLAARRAKRKAK